MLAFFILLFLLSIGAFLLMGWNKRRHHYGQTPLSPGLLIPGALLGPWGTLMGKLLFNTPVSSIVMILAGVGLILWCATAWLLF